MEDNGNGNLECVDEVKCADEEENKIGELSEGDAQAATAFHQVCLSFDMPLQIFLFCHITSVASRFET